MGGHDVPAAVVRRRFGRSVANFFSLYAPLADNWVVYDNSASPLAELLAEFDGKELAVKAPMTWQELQKLAAGP